MLEVKLYNVETKEKEKHNMPIPKSMSHFMPKRILVVTDDSMIEIIVHQALQQSGLKYQFKVSKNGYETATQMLKFHPDLVIISLLTERLDGIEIIKQIKREPETRESKILIIKNGDMDASVETTLELEINGSLNMPLQPEAVKKAIWEAVCLEEKD